MSENNRPEWWAKNPYKTNENLHHKPDDEKAWEEASDACYEAWSKAMEEMSDKLKMIDSIY